MLVLHVNKYSGDYEINNIIISLEYTRNKIEKGISTPFIPLIRNKDHKRPSEGNRFFLNEDQRWGNSGSDKCL